MEEIEPVGELISKYGSSGLVRRHLTIKYKKQKTLPDHKP